MLENDAHHFGEELRADESGLVFLGEAVLAEQLIRLFDGDSKVVETPIHQLYVERDDGAAEVEYDVLNRRHPGLSNLER